MAMRRHNIQQQQRFLRRIYICHTVATIISEVEYVEVRLPSSMFCEAPNILPYYDAKTMLIS